MRRFCGLELSEADVAAKAEAWLRDEGFDVYREVAPCDGYARADLVGLRGGTTHVVECKTRLSLDVIEQAHGWVGRSEQVSVCVVSRANASDRLPAVVLRTLGVGLLELNPMGGLDYARVRVRIQPRWHRVRRDERHVRAALRPEHKIMGEAGTRNGGYVTPFRLWMRDVAKYVADHRGATVREIVDALPHGYATAKSARECTWSAVERGLCPGVEFDGNGGLRPTPSRDGGAAKGNNEGGSRE